MAENELLKLLLHEITVIKSDLSQLKDDMAQIRSDMSVLKNEVTGENERAG